jgi:hypothetical protein
MVCPLMAHLIISLPRSNLVAFGANQTWKDVRTGLGPTRLTRSRPSAAINGCGKFSVILDFHYQVRDRDFTISDVVIDLSNAQTLAGLI